MVSVLNVGIIVGMPDGMLVKILVGFNVGFWLFVGVIRSIVDCNVGFYIGGTV